MISHLKPQVPEERDSERPKEADQGLVPHTTTSATQVAGDVAKGVKTALEDVVIWAEKKAEKLSEENEEGVGPYGSPATCIPSDLDPIASGVMPAMEAENVKEIQGDDASKGMKEQKKPSEGEKK